MSKKLPSQHHFIKSFEFLLTGKLTAREALIFGIVHQFECNNKPCFLSRAEFAQRINESEATAERAIQLLIKEGYLKVCKQGRKRYLSTGYPQVNNFSSDLYQVERQSVSKSGQSVSKQGADLYQVDTLTRSITRSINKTNITRSNINHLNTNKDFCLENDDFGYDDVPD